MLSQTPTKKLCVGKIKILGNVPILPKVRRVEFVNMYIFLYGFFFCYMDKNFFYIFWCPIWTKKVNSKHTIVGDKNLKFLAFKAQLIYDIWWISLSLQEYYHIHLLNCSMYNLLNTRYIHYLFIYQIYNSVLAHLKRLNCLIKFVSINNAIK